jgi:hypothetical protein
MQFLRLTSLLSFLALFIARAQSDQVIYDDAIENSWQDWSWATVNFSNTSPVRSGNDAISVTDPGTSYEALYLHHGQQGTANYVSLQFWIYVPTNGGTPVQVQATRTGYPQAAVLPAGLVENAWTQVTIPLSSLGVANVTDFDGFWIQNITDGPLTFYVDDITLVAASAPPQIVIAVDASSTVRTLDGRIYGVNTAVWDSQFGTPANASLLAVMGAQIFRFPGGSTSDNYNWQTDRNASNGTFQWASSIATFAPMISSLGAQACITVNYGSGTPEQAAAWVAYCNASATNTTTLGTDSMGRNWQTAGYWGALRGAAPLATDDGYNFLRIAHPVPFAFAYWEVGNENYGSWETDLHGVNGSGLSGVANDPYTYAQSFALFFAKMHAVDPTIHIGAPAIPGEDAYGTNTHAVANPNEGGSLHSGWTPVVLANLKTLGVTPQFLVDHIYPQGPGAESDAFLLQAGSTAASDAANLRKMITDYFGTGGAAIELQMTELNSVDTNPGKQSVSLVNGLFLADMIGQTAATEFNACMWWDLRNGSDSTQNNSASLYGWRLYGDYGLLATGDRSDTPLNTPYPPYYAAKLLTHWARGGDTIVATYTNYSLLSAYAAHLANGNLALLVINKSPTTDYSAQIALANFLPGSATASVYSYGKANDLANADLTGSTISNAGATFSATFPSYSMTVIVLQQPQSFALWRSRSFTAAELNNTAISGPTADPNQRGVPNLLAYALGLTPATASASALPVTGQQTVGGKIYLTLTFTRPLTIGDITYNVEVSGDLQTWNSGSAYAIRTDDGTTNQAVFRDVTAIGDTPRHFLRLQITQP